MRKKCSSTSAWSNARSYIGSSVGFFQDNFFCSVESVSTPPVTLAANTHVTTGRICAGLFVLIAFSEPELYTRR